ncbi:MAG: PDZ domain-containing protein [Desulfobacterales bacterium]|nr:PDZ domain-containing protein [Desulfobacterales bacterium]
MNLKSAFYDLAAKVLDFTTLLRKIFTIQLQIRMVYLFLFLAYCFFQLSPNAIAIVNNSVIVRNQRLTIHVKDVPLERILQQISERTKISILFYGSIKQTVSIELVDMPIENTLKRLLSNSNFSFLYQKVDTPVCGNSIILKKIIVISKDASYRASRFSPVPDRANDISSEESERIYKYHNKNIVKQKAPIAEETSAETENTFEQREGFFFDKADRDKFRTLDREELYGQIAANTVTLRHGLSEDETGTDIKDYSQDNKGIQITSISKGSLFSQIGLNAGDVIRNINGTEITSSKQMTDGIQRAISGPGSGMIIRIEVERESNIEPIYVEME